MKAPTLHPRLLVLEGSATRGFFVRAKLGSLFGSLRASCCESLRELLDEPSARHASMWVLLLLGCRHGTLCTTSAADVSTCFCCAHAGGMLSPRRRIGISLHDFSTRPPSTQEIYREKREVVKSVCSMFTALIGPRWRPASV